MREEGVRREDECKMVRVQGQHEVLVVLPEEMAEGDVDRSGGYLVRAALLINIRVRYS